MNTILIIKLLTIFLITFSLASLAGPMDGSPITPRVQLAHANSQACQVRSASGACSEAWYPAGPSMDTLVANIFTDETAEFVNLQAASPNIDFTDWPLPQSLVAPLTGNSNFLVSAPVSSHSYFEIEFMLANNFWGVNFDYGNNPNGIQIRQGISHLIDKAEFVASDANIGGTGTPIDNPLPPSNGGLPSPNPCAWDAFYPESGAGCVVGGLGGVSYHLAGAGGVNYAWQPTMGSPDFCAAAQHFVNAGLATGKSPTTCVLTGIASAVTAHTVNFFIRSDDPARLDIGDSLAQEICALFGQGFVTGCSPYLTTVVGPITAFPGFTTSRNSVNLSWGMYTAGFLGVFPFDTSLFFSYNSRFVSGISSIQSPTGPCSSLSVSTFSAANYLYLCNGAYDNMTGRVEFAPCITAVGDPSPGSTSNGPGGQCTGTNQLSAVSAGVQAENLFGQGAYTIPIFTTSQQYAYLNGWSRAVNNDGAGVPTYFTWLNAYNPAPAQTGTIRQGFKQTTRSLNPYIASTAWDFYVLSNIYDTLNVQNPLSNEQILDWMDVAVQRISSSLLGYTPPAGTVATYRFTLRSGLYWQDGRQVTPWDVKFTMLTLKATGAFQGSVLEPVIGVTVVNQHQFDINLNAIGPFTLSTVTTVTILPGRYWSTCAGSQWDGYVSTGSVPDSCMLADPNKTTATYDPLANGILVGSGPWECKSGTGVLGGGCATSGFQNPPPGQTYTLTRFGKGLPPASTTSGIYFRSSGNLALYIWTQENDANPLQAVSAVSLCYGLALGTGACRHWQQGIGANTATGQGQCSVSQAGCVGINQVSAVEIRYNLNWIAPFEWTTGPPVGIGALPPTLYEGPVTFTPCQPGGSSPPGSTTGYDC